MRRLFAAAALACLAACGHGLGPGLTPPPVAANSAAIIVDGGPPASAVGSVNAAYVTVTVCLPMTTTCQMIDHVLVDTGSTGLRIFASVLPSGFNPPLTAATASGAQLWECLPFADGYSWGSVRTADVKIADGVAVNQSVQLIGDPAVATAPGSCSTIGTGIALNTVDAFGAKGVLGLNIFQHDCGPACTDPAKLVAGAYYDCPNGGDCADTVLNGVTVATHASAVPLNLQVQNPVYNFSANNNGIAIVLPPVNVIGQLKATGSLILGVSTQSNNQLGAATVLGVDPVLGWVTTTYNGQTWPNSFFDSGSNGLFFNDSTLPACTAPQPTGFYCPLQPVSLQASNRTAAAGVSTITFTVDSLATLNGNNPQFNVLPGVAGPNPLPASFDWGLPFFFGRTVYVGFEGRSAGSSQGPFVAYQ